MFLLAAALFLAIGIVCAGVLVYRWVFLAQRNHTCGTLAIPRKPGEQAPGPLARALRAVRRAVVGMVEPIEWSAMAPRFGPARTDAPTRSADRRTRA